MKRLEHTEARFTIEKPSKQSEFEVQAYLYGELKKRGFDVRGEVLHIHRTAGKTRVCRFDLVIFRNDVAAVIIECKNERRKHVAVNGRQCTRYREYGIPVYVVIGADQADEVLDRLKPKDPRKAWRFDRFISNTLGLQPGPVTRLQHGEP